MGKNHKYKKYDSDSDDYHDGYSDNEDIEYDEPDNENQQSIKPNENINELDGVNYHIKDWSQCFYCTKYHPKSMHISNLDYCGHCWAWLNSSQIDLENGKYTGDISIGEVMEFIKTTYPLHSKNCSNNECIYNKINLLSKINKLHDSYCISLGFIKKETITINNSNKNYNYKIRKPHSNPPINYNLSNISI